MTAMICLLPDNEALLTCPLWGGWPAASTKRGNRAPSTRVSKRALTFENEVTPRSAEVQHPIPHNRREQSPQLAFISQEGHPIHPVVHCITALDAIGFTPTANACNDSPPRHTAR